MNDEFSKLAEPDISGNEVAPVEVILREPLDEGIAPGARASPATSFVALADGLDMDRINGDRTVDKSDSEAETVVLPGKELDQDHGAGKAIKLEEAGESRIEVDEQQDKYSALSESRSEGTDGKEGKRSLKRKRSSQISANGFPQEGGNSSNLSSTTSSPIQEARSSKASDAASDRSRSSPPFDEGTSQQERRRNKQKARTKFENNQQQERKSGRDGDPTSTRKRRDTRSATHFDEPANRSESPPASKSIRATSHSGVTKRRKPPAPLNVDRRRKISEEVPQESDDSSSVQSYHPRNKFASAENNAMSPAKAVSHKKNRDKNGRTLLARACAQDAAEVQRWLKERPQDLDVPDNAGNTPLQIAALQGDTDIVQMLLDAGCDINCRNIDKDTPLIDAVENGHLQVVKLLLKAGLDPRIGNARGREPLDLVPDDDVDGEAIRAALLASKKEKELLRRPSEDHHRQPSAGSREVETASGTSPVNSARSPPPPAPGARRRTARSQATDDALLWVNATPARLRDAAGKGDDIIVNHILAMRPQADTESILAAARGGHEVVLGLLLAIGQPEPDPEPLRDGDHKNGYNTPLLAAIGRGNNKVIELLLQQPGFDPTRRIYKGLTYYEIAKERKGSEWEEEVDMLKDAYDKYKPNEGRKSNSSSPRKVRAKRADSLKSTEPSSSPHEMRKARRPFSHKKEDSPDDDRRESSHKEDSVSHPKGISKKISSANSSDREGDPLGPPRSKPNDGRRTGDAGSLASKTLDMAKPKRRLMSGNERRASLAAEASEEFRRKKGDFTPGQEHERPRSSDAFDATKKPSREELPQGGGEHGKKRHRMSISPQASKLDVTANGDVIKKKKRQRVDSHGNAIDQERDRSTRPGPATAANMIVTPTTAPSPTGTAPVAFMGNNVASPTARSPTDLPPDTIKISPVNSIDETLNQEANPDDVHAQALLEHDVSGQADLVEDVAPRTQREEEEKLAMERAERQRRLDAEREEEVRAEKAEAECKARIAREEQEARLEAQRQAEQVEKQLQQEREEEEARIAKRKQDEEMQKRRQEQERHRREEQERRRREQEEREALRKIRLQEEQDRLRRAALPNGLRRAAELSADDARAAKEITKWLPLRTVTTQELNPEAHYDPQMAEELWITNVQAGPILAITDLGLSQCQYLLRFLSIVSSLLTPRRHCLGPNTSDSKSPGFPLAPTSKSHVPSHTSFHH